MNAKEIKELAGTKNLRQAEHIMFERIKNRTWIDDKGIHWLPVSIHGKTTEKLVVGFSEVLPPARNGVIPLRGKMPFEDAIDRVTGSLTRGALTDYGFGIILK